ncbi:MAG TPA: hypothetical protein VLE96_05030 [Chlamydiales bacterium]|nr:hypothetical protein [Chlamydiales bacterium]
MKINEIIITNKQGGGYEIQAKNLQAYKELQKAITNANVPTGEKNLEKKTVVIDAYEHELRSVLEALHINKNDADKAIDHIPKGYAP